MLGVFSLVMCMYGLIGSTMFCWGNPQSCWRLGCVAHFGELGRTNMQDTMESTMLVVVVEDDIYGGDEKKGRLISM